jgi:hypothetical protein
MEFLVWVAIVVGVVAALLTPGGQKEPADSPTRRQRPSIALSVLAAFLLGRSMDCELSAGTPMGLSGALCTDNHSIF